jgi:DNA modification methylase
MIIREERIGGQRLILGDCAEIMPTLGRFDACITDPPYGIGFPYNSYDDTLDALEALVAVYVPAAIEAASRVVITPGVSNISIYPKPAWTGAWTWETTATFGHLGFSQWQPILFYGEDVKGFGSVNGVLKSDRIHFTGGSAKIVNADGMGHTCPKPLAFVERLLNRFSAPGETILDPLAGSGTTLVACQRLGRQGTGIELDPDYFAVMCKRVDEASRQPDLFIAPTPKPEQTGMDI